MREQTRELAEQAAEAIRSLNHLTMPGRDLQYPADVYKIVGSLRTMAQHLPQLFGELAKFLIAEANAGRIGHDSGESGAPREGGPATKDHPHQHDDGHDRDQPG